MHSSSIVLKILPITRYDMTSRNRRFSLSCCAHG